LLPKVARLCIQSAPGMGSGALVGPRQGPRTLPKCREETIVGGGYPGIARPTGLSQLKELL
jgi:hypothetical protein